MVGLESYILHDEIIYLILDLIFKLQGDLFDSNSAKGLLWAYLGCSEGPNSFFVTPRLGANYYLVRNTLKWV